LNVKDFLSVFLERIKFLCFSFCPFIFYFWCNSLVKEFLLQV
jgi:hypothetical protein